MVKNSKIFVILWQAWNLQTKQMSEYRTGMEQASTSLSK